nr:DUF3105 domain-containing protein [Nocardiopsis alkaliphila]
MIGGGLLGLVLFGAAGFGLWALLGSQTPGPGTGVVAGEDGFEDVRLFDDLPREHVPTGETVDYEQFPPVGGEHYAFWQNCGVYDEPVLTEAAVHSLEHGAVWITHDPELDPDQIERLAAHHQPGSYVLVSPMEGLPSPIVASAWGAQLQLDDASDERVDAFLREYEQSPDAPEPGAPCSGAYDGTEAEAETEGVDARMN